MQPVADDEPAVVVHERHQVDPAILPLENKRKQVGLPERIRAGAFEARLALRMGLGRRPLPCGSRRRAAPWRRPTGLAGKAGPRNSMSLMRWQPQAGIGLLEHQDGAAWSGRKAGCRAVPPLGLSISPPGPSSSNFFFQA